jgi:hypothetical protein
MKKLAVFILIVAQLPATSFFYDLGELDTDGTHISWQGSSTAFSGAYRWPANRKPLSRYNGGQIVSGGQLSTEPDFIVASCDAATDTITIALSNFFGRRLEAETGTSASLPTGMEITFVGSSVAATTQPNGTTTKWDGNTTSTPPCGLVQWEQDQYKKYYVRDGSGATFKVSATPGGAAIDLQAGTSVGTTGFNFAGYTNAMAFMMARGMSFTCDAATDICTTPVPHLRNSGNAVFVHSTGTLPAGFPYRGYGGQKYGYVLEVLTTTTFKFRKGGVADQIDTGDFLSLATAATTWASRDLINLTTAGTGTHYMHAFDNTSAAFSTWGQGVAFRTFSGYPAGTVLTFRAGGQPSLADDWTPGTAGANRPLFNFPSGDIMTTVIAKIPAITAAGDYPVTITTSEAATSSTNPATYTFKLKVVSLTPTSFAGPSSYPTIPGKASSIFTTGQCGGEADAGDCSWASWDNVMVDTIHGGGASDPPSGRHRRCTDRSNATYPMGMSVANPAVGYDPLYSGTESALWYYASRTQRKIADYTGDRDWANCTIYLADRMLSVGVSSIAIRNFTGTPLAAYAETGNPKYRAFVFKQTRDTPYEKGQIREIRMREAAYSMAHLHDSRELTGAENYDMDDQATALIGMIHNTATVAPERIYHQVFMGGLVAKELTLWYALTRDERVPYVLKALMDYYWPYFSTTQDGTGFSGFPYTLEPAGLRCYVNCEERLSSKLNNYISPIFAWYWRLTGNETYRTRGDTIFSYQFRDGQPYHAKEYSQTYYWSWDFVKWREGAPVF